MIKFAPISLVLVFICDPVMACREGYGSSWSKSEVSILADSEWVSVIEIDRSEQKGNNVIYFYKVIRNLKGSGPKKNKMSVGPFSKETSDFERKDINWKDKGCVQHVFLEKGKQYILFSNLNNPNSIQFFTPENESRISNQLNPAK